MALLVINHLDAWNIYGRHFTFMIGRIVPIWSSTLAIRYCADLNCLLIAWAMMWRFYTSSAVIASVYLERSRGPISWLSFSDYRWRLDNFWSPSWFWNVILVSLFALGRTSLYSILLSCLALLQSFFSFHLERRSLIQINIHRLCSLDGWIRSGQGRHLRLNLLWVVKVGRKSQHILLWR